MKEKRDMRPNRWIFLKQSLIDRLISIIWIETTSRLAILR